MRSMFRHPLSPGRSDLKIFHAGAGGFISEVANDVFVDLNFILLIGIYVPFPDGGCSEDGFNRDKKKSGHPRG